MTVDATFKICIFGPGGVGKTSLTKKYLTGQFDIDTKMTLGAAINVHYLTIEGIKVSLQIWDFGGENQFRFLLPVYAHGSSAGIFMYDVTRFDTLTKVDEWLDAFTSDLTEAEKQIPIMMVGGKIDLKEKRSVDREEAEALAKAQEFYDYIECSAKTGENVSKIFEDLTRYLLTKVNLV